MSNTKSPTDLPFVGLSTSKTGYLSFWSVDRHAKNYLEGTKQGAELARQYLDYVAVQPGAPPLLPQIVMDMLTAPSDTDGAKGQIVGFLSAVEAKIAAKTTK